MNRRSVLAMLGIAGTGAAVGTGAFSSAEAQRTVNISVANEDEAILALSPVDDDFVDRTNDRNQIRLDFNDVIDDVTDFDAGTGPGSGSRYAFDRLFSVSNLGTQTVYLESSFDGDENETYDEEIGSDQLGFYVAEKDDLLLDGEIAVAELDVGDTAEVGVMIDTHNIDVPYFGSNNNVPQNIQFDLTATITATDEVPGEGVEIIESTGDSSPDV